MKQSYEAGMLKFRRSSYKGIEWRIPPELEMPRSERIFQPTALFLFLFNIRFAKRPQHPFLYIYIAPSQNRGIHELVLRNWRVPIHSSYCENRLHHNTVESNECCTIKLRRLSRSPSSGNAARESFSRQAGRRTHVRVNWTGGIWHDSCFSFFLYVAALWSSWAWHSTREATWLSFSHAVVIRYWKTWAGYSWPRASFSSGMTISHSNSQRGW